MAGGREEAIGRETKNRENRTLKGQFWDFLYDDNPQPEPQPQPSQSQAPQGRTSGGYYPESQESQRNRQIADGTGANVDFNSLEDMQKLAAWYAVNYYTGFNDPSSWAKGSRQSMEAQGKGVPVQELDRFATYMKNIMRMENALRSDEVPAEKYPWWSAARDWNPNMIGKIGRKMSNAFTPSAGVIEGITSRF